MPAMPFPIAANTEKSPLPAAIIPITKKKNALAKIPISLPPSDDHLLT